MWTIGTDMRSASEVAKRKTQGKPTDSFGNPTAENTIRPVPGEQERKKKRNMVKQPTKIKKNECIDTHLGNEERGQSIHIRGRPEERSQVETGKIWTNDCAELVRI